MKIIMSAISCAALAGCSPAPSGNTQAAADALGGTGIISSTAEADTSSKGPFGLEMGQPIGSLKLTKMDQPGLYKVDSVPNPHAEFESVVVEAYPGTGICQIRAIGKDIDGDGSGVQVRSRADELAEVLATKYGPGKKSDLCSGGDVACEGQFWMMSMGNGERWYGYLWEKPTAAMKAVKIGEIAVAANASDINTSYAVVEYHSIDKTACEAAKKSKSAESL